MFDCEKGRTLRRLTELILRLDYEIAGKMLIAICSTLVIFHLANIFGMIPINITWLGQIDSDNKIKLMSVASVALNMIIIFCAAVKIEYVKSTYLILVVEKVLPFVFWWLIGNSIANLFSKSKFELVVFTPLLIVLTVCVFVLMNTDSIKK